MSPAQAKMASSIYEGPIPKLKMDYGQA